MSAEVLRQAAALMRERAEGVRCTDDEWYSADEMTGIILRGEGFKSASQRVDATHISSWHPAVALAVAEWLEFEANCTERACQQFPAHEWGVDARSLAVARAYLNADAKEDAR